MAISSQAQRILDAYATTVGGKRDPRYANVINVMQNAPPRTWLLPLLGSMLVLTACTATPSSSLPTSTLAKGKTINTAIESRPPKRSLDGSKPFTMPEIEERLLKVLALPPAQIGKESVEHAFGFVLFKEDGGAHGGFFKEEFAEDRRVSYLVSLSSPSGSAVFEYNTLYKTTWEDGSPMLSTEPREIPVDYKFPHSVFVQKLQALGWKEEVLDTTYGVFRHSFMKDGFLLDLYLDILRRGEDDQVDYSQTRISRIVINTPRKR